MKAKVKAARKAGFAGVVIYGDCGTGGQLDAFPDEENMRLPGPHCYHSLMDEAGFDTTMAQEVRAFFLTDYLCLSF